MKQYHVNKDGVVGVCRATNNCPFGSQEDHHPSETAAREAYENSMKFHEVRTHNAGRARPRRVEPKLSTVMDTELLESMVKQNYVMTSPHPEDPNLVVMSYSKQAQAAGKWNDATKQARGLIVRKNGDSFADATLVERPWRKFFTLSQIQGEDGKPGWALGDEDDGPQVRGGFNETDNLDFEAPAEVTDKMDGSLGVLYRAPDGKLSVSTKGSFASDQAIAYTKMLRENPKYYDAAEKLKSANPGTTFLFELVGKDNQIVLNYEKDDIVFLGAVDSESGVYRSTKDFPEWSEDEGLTRAETMEAGNLREALALPDRENREGVVVRLKSDDPEKQMQLKIKQEDYLKLHRLLNAVSKTKTRELLRDSVSSTSVDNLMEVAKTKDITHIPRGKETLEFYRTGESPLHKKLYDEQRAHFENAILPKVEAMKSAHDYVEGLPEERFQGDHRDLKKAFAVEVKDKPPFERAQAFEFFNARLQKQEHGHRLVKGMFKAMSQDV